MKDSTGLTAAWYSSAARGLPSDVRAAFDRLRDGDEIEVSPLSDDTVVGNGVLDGLGDSPVLLTQVTLVRDIMAQGRQVLTYVTLSLLTFIGLSVVALILVLNTSVLTRLAQLSQAVGEIGASETPSSRVAVRGHDEIATLAEGINGMLDALERSRFELVELATHDALTGVYNRRRFDEELARELAEESRLGQGGAVLWFDLDDFKSVNDEFGHGVGDEVLVSFAETLRAETRGYSTLARIGGDEFVMVIPAADEAEALQRRAAPARRVGGGTAQARRRDAAHEHEHRSGALPARRAFRRAAAGARRRGDVRGEEGGTRSGAQLCTGRGGRLGRRARQGRRGWRDRVAGALGDLGGFSFRLGRRVAFRELRAQIGFGRIRRAGVPGTAGDISGAVGLADTGARRTQGL